MRSSTQTTCLDEQQALDLVGGALPVSERQRLHGHLADCSICAALVADLARVLGGDSRATASRRGPTGADDTPDELTAPLPSGTTIGPYRVLYPLAAGGMGVVYVGQDPRLERRIALKLLRADRLEPRAGQRLRREAQALARLSSPNVVAVLAVGDSSYGTWVAMELVAGQTLAAWLADGPRPWRQVLQRFDAAAQGLRDAHAAGIVHRDFKPSNVLLGDDGRVRVADFGLAATHEPVVTPTDSTPDVERTYGDRMTQTRGLVGTPAYMAPEQLSGLGADARSDQFSYCVALYEGLFGQRPYPGTTIAALLDSIEHGRFCSPPASAGVPRWVTQALRRGLDPEPTRRHRDMAALRLALDPARPRRQRTVATIALAAALPLGVAAWASQQPPDTACQDARERAETAWSDDDREALAHAFTRLDPPRRGPILATAVRHLDARTATWTAAYSRACDANRRGVAPPRTDQQLQCLQTVLHETQTAVDRLIDAAPEGLMRADTVVRGLTAVDDCQDPRALDRRLWANADPAAAAPIQQLRRDIAKARIRLAVDQDIQDAVEDYQELNARAATLGALAQRLQTANVVGRLLHIQGRSEEAAQILEPNYFAAHEANDVTESYEAAAQLVQVYGHGLGALEPALQWSRHAEAAATAGGDGNQRATALLVRGELLDNFDRDEEAERTLLAAHAALPAGGRIRTRASVAETLGNLYAARDEPDRAMPWFDQALELQLRRVGPKHHDLLRALNGRAVALIQLERYDEALATFNRMTVITDGGGSYTASINAQMQSNIAALHELRHNLDQALDAYQRSHAALTELRGPAHDETLSTLFGVANVHRQRSDYPLAIQTATTMLNLTLSRDPPRVRLALKALWVIAESSLAQGDRAGAVAAMRRRLALRREHTPDNAEGIASDEADVAELLAGDGPESN